MHLPASSRPNSMQEVRRWNDSGSMLDSIFRDRNNPPIAKDPRTSTARRIGLDHPHLATLYVCLFSHLYHRLRRPDEPRYAWIARDMAETAISPVSMENRGSKSPSLLLGAALLLQALRR